MREGNIEVSEAPKVGNWVTQQEITTCAYQHGAVGSTVIGRIWNLLGVYVTSPEPRPGRFVGGEETFARRRHALRDPTQKRLLRVSQP